MNILCIVSQDADWVLDIAGVEVVPAQRYLRDPRYRTLPATRVFNLCDAYDYQSTGYYVSLLAQARGQPVLPDVRAIETLNARDPAATLPATLAALIQTALATAEDGDAVVEIDSYFGRSLAPRHATLCERLFNWARTPMLRAGFVRIDGRWRLQALANLPMASVPAPQRALVRAAAAECLQAHDARAREPSARAASIAILCDRKATEQPSNPLALQRFVAAAEALGMRAELITLADRARLSQFDGLFMRTTTAVDHYTYELARQAAHAGLVVIDDADSILKCNNKVYLAELLRRHAIPTPASLHVDRDHLDEIVPALGLPCILKRPDGAFSRGVLKVDSAAQLQPAASTLLANSDWILAQEYLPTPFDWRVGIIDRRPLFVCKYFMAHGHWQIIKHGRDKRWQAGATEAVRLDAAPPQVLALALRAAELIGDGLYGVDLKQHGERHAVIEVNDNPNIDAGNEDAILHEALYREVMLVFRRRIEQRKQHAGRRA